MVGLSPQSLEAYLSDPRLRRHALGEGSEGRPLDDILGCATNPGTVVLLAAPLTGVGEQAAELCWKLCLGLAAFEPLSAAVRQRLAGSPAAAQAAPLPFGAPGGGTLDPAADAEVNLRTLHGVARDFKEWYGERVDHVAVGRQRATCAVSGIGWRIKMQVKLSGHPRTADERERIQSLALIAAAAENDARQVENLLAAGVDPNRSVESSTGQEWSALHFAARLRAREAAEVLVRRGADPNVRGLLGHTALLEAGPGARGPALPPCSGSREPDCP